MVNVWQSMKNYLSKLGKNVFPDGTLKNNSDLLIYGHSSNRKWNRNMDNLMELFIVERLQGRCLADQKKIIEHLYSPVATKKMCLAMFCSGEEDERTLAAYFKSGVVNHSDNNLSLVLSSSSGFSRLSVVLQTIVTE